MSTLPLFIMFLLSLAIPPFQPLRQIRLQAFIMTITLPFLPASSFDTLPDRRPMEVTRSIVRLTFAYSLLAGFGAILRTLKRIGGWKITESSSNRLLKVILLWLLAWRTGTLPFVPPINAWKRPIDVTTVVAFGTGAICLIDEIRGIIRLIRSGGPEAQSKPQPRSGIASRLIQILLSIHRILLAIRNISAGFTPPYALGIAESADYTGASPLS
ncbi:uncharacterized protein I303_105600 [Kwoniella dejecticola CBS 10117]|uniref:Uncharacterized protein n=1 Tax=Kwoniella dejecticola CBS 10117 TaxID=1296121 RepID=A0A1A6A213_9TREE|nr:uncharacterized protein I303_04957 [Kwoniella dejecticola CBS 10117]OBR84100.1 hypothetical protein I303_04957 [Kwoniella dejecticola CBS 10117]